MKTAIVLGTFICGVSAWWYAQASAPTLSGGVNVAPVAQSADEKVQPPDKRKTPKLLSEFMRKKLDASNGILEGLVTDDLRMVSNACDALLNMSTAEKWRASNDMMYLQHSEEFRNSVKHLRDKADGASIDGAALAWVDVTMNCIQCHEWVRNVMIADVPSR
jgi:hypothetical protein